MEETRLVILTADRRAAPSAEPRAAALAEEPAAVSAALPEVPAGDSAGRRLVEAAPVEAEEDSFIRAGCLLDMPALFYGGK